MRLKVWFGPLVVLAVLLAGTGYWFWWQGAADRLAAGFDRWVEARRAEGIMIDHGPVDVGGFPYRLTLRLDNAAIALPGQPGAPEWSADRVEIYFQPWEKGHAVIGIEGQQRFGWDGPQGRRAANARTDSTYASLRFDDAGTPETFALDAREVKVTGDVPLQAMQRFQVHARANRGEDPDRPAGSLNLATHGDGITLAEGASPLGTDIAIARISTLVRPEPAGTTPEQLDAWRDAGGVIDILGLEITTKALGITGDGTVALDEQRRPEAAGVLVVRGAANLVDALAASGVVKPYAGVGLKIAIAAMERPDDKGTPTINLPWTIQNGELSALDIRLVKVAPLY
ncbi:MAG: DUF2125 domain-containing protein [Pseudomonadota bacterium]|nr:DUF2125 domain-containing protein [Pseudomonadota bacterium]